jgi:O-antigen/teichoic acid export membrane protein
MLGRINVGRIVKDHLATLRNDVTGERMRSDYFVFFGLPLLVAFFLVFVLNLSLDQGAVGILVTSLSVFAALLFNLLLLIYDVVRKIERRRQGLKERFLSQIYSNISFAILVSIVSIIVLLVAYFDLDGSWFAPAASFFVYYLVTLFVLTLFMILKRVHILLKLEFEDG